MLLPRSGLKHICGPRSATFFSRVPGFTEPIGAYTIGGLHPVHINSVFKGRYRVVRKLGFGRFATVWLAKDENAKQYVALKVKSASYEDDPSQEARILASLGYSNLIVPLLDSFEVNGPNGRHQVLVLAVLTRTLAELIERAMARRMIAAVDYLHSREIMHRGKSQLLCPTDTH
ncbi:hypothetical protein ANO11243_049520 [Dothideomycetidae sp. 11243]|nr:hypothetical protein ANO11243_049520 [fungal sp. No.11243]